ncbi:hypothetical protein B0G76_3700 [Paraburkholderia sp. BL23I1N1]|nr:hypothetical protein B0G76_3700 [Paraburkholderia sp. BL23I1N1]
MLYSGARGTRTPNNRWRRPRYLYVENRVLLRFQPAGGLPVKTAN